MRERGINHVSMLIGSKGIYTIWLMAAILDFKLHRLQVADFKEELCELFIHFVYKFSQIKNSPGMPAWHAAVL